MSGALLVLLLASTAAANAPQRVAIAEVSAPPTMVGLGAQITDELATLARAQKLAVVPPEEVRRALGDKLYAEVNDCGTDAKCLAERVAALGPLRLVSGTLGRTENAYVLDLWLYDGARRAFVATARLSVLIASRRLLLELREAVPRLLRGEPQATGTLAVSADVEGATAMIDGAPVPSFPFELELSAGKHALRVEKPGHLAVDRLVLVRPGQRTEEKVKLYPEPKRVDLTPGDPSTETVVTRRPGLRVPGFAVATLSTGAVAIAGAVVLGMAARRTTVDAQRAQGYRLGSVALYVAGGTLMGAGVIATVYQTAHVEPGVQIAYAGVW